MISATEPRQKLCWAAVFGLVVAAHGGLLALLGPVAKPPEPVGEPAISIDLSPAPEPEPAKDLAPPEPDSPPEAALAEPAPAQPAPAEAGRIGAIAVRQWNRSPGSGGDRSDRESCASAGA
jgi:hypothetical protein